jgi:DNA-damage-inducible protein D
MNNIEFFNGFSEENFETFSNKNAFIYWWASDLMKMLGYENRISFQKAINKAMTTCNTLNIPIVENFIQEKKNPDDMIYDFKLSRFACYLTVMNGDPKKTNVAKAQGYFATLAGAVQHFLTEAEKVERLQIRSEISDRESTLSGIAKSSGIEEGKYGYFQNAGYRGLYNMNINDLRKLRNIELNKSPLDFMGKDELAANLFRLTQTELKIKNEEIKGQIKLENAAYEVGSKVRKTMLEISNTAPENLPKHQDINEVKKELKKKGKEFKKLDKNKKKE